MLWTAILVAGMILLAVAAYLAWGLAAGLAVTGVALILTAVDGRIDWARRS